MTVRLATPDDASAVAEIYRPFVTGTAVSFEVSPPAAADMAARITATMPAHPWLVWDDGRVRGYAYGARYRARAAYRWSVETAIYLGGDARGRGVGRRLYRALLAVLRAQGYRQALAGATVPNPASAALHEALGYRHIGTYPAVGFKLGSWHDVAWWQLSLQDEPGQPPGQPEGIPEEIRTIEQLSATELGTALVAGRSTLPPD